MRLWERWSQTSRSGRGSQMACCPGLVTKETEIKTLTMSEILNDHLTGWQPLPNVCQRTCRNAAWKGGTDHMTHYFKVFVQNWHLQLASFYRVRTTSTFSHSFSPLLSFFHSHKCLKSEISLLVDSHSFASLLNRWWLRPMLLVFLVTCIMPRCAAAVVQWVAQRVKQ